MRTAAFLLCLLSAPASAYDPAAGKRLYLEHCAKCHGASGKGDGPAAVRLDPRPRDLTSGLYKIRSTPSGSPASSDDLLRTLSRGMPGSAMPSFEGILSLAEMRDVAGYALSLAQDTGWKTEPGITIGAPPARTDRRVAHGAQLYRKLGCSDCHGDKGRGDGPSAASLAGESGRPTRPTDLSAPWAYKGGAEAADIVMRLSAGLDATPMPSFQDQTSLADRWDLAFYLASLRRKPAWEMDAAELTRWDAERLPTQEARGAYLARALTCGLCHTASRASDGAYNERGELAGGVKIAAYPFAVYYSRNLTPDRRTGLGGWSQADIVRALKTGTRPDGGRIAFIGMPWAFFAALPDQDLEALAAYLKTLPSVENDVPPARPFPYLENIGYKLAHVFLRRPATFEVWPGNSTRGGAGDVPQGRRRMAYYGFFGGVLLLLILSGWLLQAALTRRRRWQQAVALAASAGTLLVGAAGCASLYFLPPLDFLPPEKVVEAVTSGLPMPKPADPRQMPIAMRGRTLVNANCAMCHTPVPMLIPPDARLALAGGSKVTSPFFGTRYTRNLTPDPETGLGGWSVPEILRAVKSGSARDGRQIHWLDMPWDRFSNFDEEDLAAIAIYLKSIPPVKHRVPPPGPGAADDPPALSFYFGDSGKLVE